MIITTKNRATSFIPTLYIDNTGVTIPNDSPPTNLASVASGRRMQIPKGILLTTGLGIVGFAIDGTSCVIRFWWYDAAHDIWVANGATGTLTTGSTNTLINTVGCMPGSLWHCQVVSNVGVTKLSVLIR